MVPLTGRRGKPEPLRTGYDPLSPPPPPRGSGPATVWRFLRWMLAVDPVRSVALIAAECVQGLMPAAEVWVVRYAFADAVGLVRGTVPETALLSWIGLWAALRLVRSLLWPVTEVSLERLRQEMEDAFHRELQRKAAALRLEVFERPDFGDILRRASRGSDPLSFFLVMQGVWAIPREAAALAALAVVVGAWSPWLLVATVLAGLPDPLGQVVQSRSAFFLVQQQTARDRLRNYLGGILTGRAAAKEVRTFGLAGWLLERWSRLYRQTMDERLRLSVRQNLARAGLGSIGSLGVAAGLAVAAVGLLAGSLQPGQFAAMLIALQGVQGAAASLVTALGSYLGDRVLTIADLFVYLDLGPEERSGGSPAGQGGEDITAERLSFRYPLRAEPTLRGLSFRLGAGERVALVGENGAGKTTLVKVLLGLYRPTGGRVLYGGRDLEGLDLRAVRDRQAAVFQDHVRYAFTLWENVGYGRAERVGDRAAVEAAAARGGADDVAASLPAGYETLLTRQFSGGTDLSGGQWQRVAVSRGLMREAPLLVLDEPTAALDPVAEADAFRRFAAVARGRTAILVSHRLGFARLCDRVLVLRGGELVEQGGHDELVAAGGEYARLWATQAQWYL